MPWWLVLLLVVVLFVAWAVYKRRNNTGDLRGRLPDDGRHSGRGSYFTGD